MKNNIILILVVTIISVAIIVASVLMSSGGDGESESEDISSQTTSVTTVTTTATPQTEPTTTTTVSAPATSTAPLHDVETAEQIIATAQSLLGIDFVDDGDDPDIGFDNSGFIYYVLRENGYITCPRGVAAQAQMGSTLAYSELKPGDLAFFSTESYSGIGFGGIYCGDGKMIACLMPGTQVKEINIESEYYQTYFSHGISIT